jgi:predicted lactoylglutathione lyase
MMIGYVTLGTKDLAKAAVFYDAIAAELDTPRMMEFDGFIAWGKPGGGAGIGLTKPFDGNVASVGNGVMVALAAKDKEQVHRLHDIALATAAPAKALRDRAARVFMRAISAIPTATS